MTPSTVLIADDDRAMAAALAERLQSVGYTTVTAQSGYEALMMTLEHRPAVLILDINMPMGNGFSIQKRLSRIPAQARRPVIFISGEPVDWLELAAIDHDAFAFFAKPIDNVQLIDAVGRAMDIEQSNAA